MATYPDGKVDFYLPYGNQFLPMLITSYTVEHGPMSVSIEARSAGAPMDYGVSSTRCPTCMSPEPRLHPATQAEGEVTHICPDPFHAHNGDYGVGVPRCPVDGQWCNTCRIGGGNGIGGECARLAHKPDCGVDPCAGGRCSDPEAHAEGAHDV